MLPITAFLLLFWTACTDKDTLLTFDLNKSFDIEQGARATWNEDDSIQLRFDRVAEDSRCPADAECVWAGRAEIEVTVSQQDGTTTKHLILGDPTGSDYTETALFGAFKVQLLEVRPTPRANQVIPQSDYAVKLLVTTE